MGNFLALKKFLAPSFCQKSPCPFFFFSTKVLASFFQRKSPRPFLLFHRNSPCPFFFPAKKCLILCIDGRWNVPHCFKNLQSVRYFHDFNIKSYQDTSPSGFFFSNKVLAPSEFFFRKSPDLKSLVAWKPISKSSFSSYSTNSPRKNRNNLMFSVPRENFLGRQLRDRTWRWSISNCLGGGGGWL